MLCTGEEEPPRPRRWRVGASIHRLASELELGQREVSIETTAAALALEWRPGNRFSVQLGIGGVIDGRLGPRGGPAHAIRPGWITSLQASWVAVAEREATPFLSLSIALGVSRARTESTEGVEAWMLSTDARIGVVVGKTLWSVWTPYVTGRAFGGPVFWRLDGEAVTGEDQHHYQLGVGSVVTFPVGIDLAIEWAPLGARGLTAGTGFAF